MDVKHDGQKYEAICVELQYFLNANVVKKLLKSEPDQ